MLLHGRWLQRAVVDHGSSQDLTLFWGRRRVLAKSRAVVGLHALDGLEPSLGHGPLRPHLLQEGAPIDDTAACLLTHARIVVRAGEVEAVQHDSDCGVDGEADPWDQAAEEVDAKGAHLLEHLEHHEGLVEELFARRLLPGLPHVLVLVIRVRAVVWAGAVLLGAQHGQVGAVQEHVAHEVDAVHVRVGLALLDGIVAVEGEEVVLQALGQRLLPALELVDELLELRRRRPRQLRLEVVGARPLGDLAPYVGGAQAVPDDADLADWEGDGRHAHAVVELLGTRGLTEDKVLALARQLDGHVVGLQRALPPLASAQQRVHQEAGPGSATADFGLDELVTCGHAVARDLELLGQVHDLDEADGHAEIDPGAPSVAGAPVVAGEHEQRLHAADARRLEVRLQHLAGVGGVGVAGLGLRAERRRGVFDEAACVGTKLLSVSCRRLTELPARASPRPSTAPGCGRESAAAASACGGSSICTSTASSCS